MPWDLFCRVVDNFGDIGVCWRLAAQLADRGQPVRLWVDDASALGWMAPGHQRSRPGVEVRGWPGLTGATGLPQPGEVVIEAFGCDPPPDFVARMAAAPSRPRWINLEYLSAEAQAERNHGLPSPQLSGPGAGLLKHFFFPGFTPASGGLLREDDLLQRRDGFDAAAWLAARGIERRPQERIVGLFCYPGAPIAALVDRLAADAARPTLLLTTAGAASAGVASALGPLARRGALRSLALPWLSQTDFDHFLWSCDLNFVRGEDSAVRAQWAGRPFIWQLYPQSDGADIAKRTAFLDRMLAPRLAAAPLLADTIRSWWQVWNEAGTPLQPLPDDLSDWQSLCVRWRDHLWAQTDLATRLQSFVAEAG